MKFVKNWLSVFSAVIALLGFAACVIASLAWLGSGGPVAKGLAALIASIAAFSATWYALEQS